MGAYYNLSDICKKRKTTLMSNNIIRCSIAAVSFLAAVSVPTISALDHVYPDSFATTHVASVSKRQSDQDYSSIKKYYRKESLKSEFNNDLNAFARIVSKNISDPSSSNSEQLKSIEKKLSHDVIKMDHILPNYSSHPMVKKLIKPKTHIQSSNSFSMRSFFKRPDVRRLIGNFNF